MTEVQRDTYRRVYARDGYRCTRCGTDDQTRLQIAHRIRQGTKSKNNAVVKYFMKKILTDYNQKASLTYIWDYIIYHEFNLTCSCERCNSSFNIWNKPMQAEELATKILRDVYEKNNN